MKEREKFPPGDNQKRRKDRFNNVYGCSMTLPLELKLFIAIISEIRLFTNNVC